MITALIIFSTILAIAIPLLPEFTYPILKCEMVVYIAIIVLDIIKTREFNLFHTWISAFIFIILSDMILCAVDDYMMEYTIPIFFYLVGNNIVLLSYRCTNTKASSPAFDYHIKHPRYLLVFIICGLALYIYTYKDMVIETLAFGRILKDSMGNTSLMLLVVSGLGTLLPSIIAYYFKYINRKSAIYSILLSLPIFLIQFIIATRFKLLFQVLPFIIILGLVRIHNVNFRSMLSLSLIGIVLITSSTYLVENRNKYATSNEYEKVKYRDAHSDDIFYTAADNMSSEGVIDMALLANDYFSKNELSYGRESSTILYFWIPRQWWPDKPTQLDHWLIRKYKNVDDAFSSASGFLGELRADFGWFALLFASLIGFALKRCDGYIQSFMYRSTPAFGIIFASLLYPYFFFFVRSPITASISLIMSFIIFIAIRTLFFHKVHIDEIENGLQS